MGFRNPQYFWFFAPFLILVGIHLWVRAKRRREIGLLGDWSVVQTLVSLEALRQRARKEGIALLALAIGIFALTGPQLGNKMKEVKSRGVDVFIAVDTSRSMLAEDVAPSRIERAKQSLGALIEKLAGNRIGIIAFSGFAVIQCPLTSDTDAARMFLDILDTNTVPKPGTVIGDAIRLAVKSFDPEAKTGKALILLTDGEDHRSDPEGAAKEARDKGVIIFTIGIGTAKGEVIKNRDESGAVTGYLKHKGEMVLSRMDEGLLSKLASLTGGRYYRASSTDREIDEISEIINNFDKREFGSKIYQRREERFYWVLWPVLFLLLFEFFFSEKPGQASRIWAFLKSVPFKNVRFFKRGVVSVLAVLLLAGPVHANVKDHLRKGAALVKKKDFAAARAEYESALIDVPESAELRYNIANTYYLEGNFDEAKRQYEQALAMAKNPSVKSKIAYNLGHVTFHAGDRSGAVERFKECLRLDPKNEDAKYNIEYILAGKNPKNPPRQQPKQDQKQSGKGQGQPQPAQPNEEKKGGLSKEQAEQLLQMMKDQEKQQMKESSERLRSQQPKEKPDEQREDW